MNTSRQIFQLASAVARRQITTSAVKHVAKDEVHPGYKRIKELQKKFQQDDGLEVYLKGGFWDNIFFKVTMGLCAVALFLDFKLYYDLSFPKKK